MFAARYFPVRYFAARYWPPGRPANIGVTTVEGRSIAIFTVDILAVEEQITEVADPVYQGVRSKIYLADHTIIVRSTKAAVIDLIQMVEAFDVTIVADTVSGREATIRTSGITAVEEQLADVRSPIYTGVRSRIYLANHTLILRLTKAAVITLIQAVEAFAKTIVVTTVIGREIEIRAANIAAVEARLADIRSSVYTGVRSRLYLEAHLIEVRITSAAALSLIVNAA